MVQAKMAGWKYCHMKCFIFFGNSSVSMWRPTLIFGWKWRQYKKFSVREYHGSMSIIIKHGTVALLCVNRMLLPTCTFTPTTHLLWHFLTPENHMNWLFWVAAMADWWLVKPYLDSCHEDVSSTSQINTYPLTYEKNTQLHSLSRCTVTYSNMKKF